MRRTLEFDILHFEIVNDSSFNIWNFNQASNPLFTKANIDKNEEEFYFPEN